MNPLIFAIPVFLGLMLFEHLYTRIKGQRVYSFRETIGNLYCAIGQVFIETFLKLPLLALYIGAKNISPLSAPTGAVKWIALFIVVDFLFWLSHLIAHKIPWMWAIHGVHHQSEHFNYSVGLRMPWWHKLTAFWIVLPPAIMGFEPSDYILVASLHGSAQIWTHTTMFPKRIPIVENIFVTPSHHRVHHAKNVRYIDKNFGGILSIWDYIFRTYEPESEPVRFGIPKIKPRVNPWSSNIVQFIPKHLPKLPKHQRLPVLEKFAIASFTMALIFAVGVVFAFEKQMTFESRMLAASLVLASMIGTGIWMDHREDWFKDIQLRLSDQATSLTTVIMILGLMLF